MSDSRAAADFSTVRDFPDRLPPIVVKELRQGLRARYFAETVAGFHAVLWVIMVTDSQMMEGTALLRLIWWLLAALMLIILPLRGLSSLTDERKANTMDTLVLTNLTAGRITRGKWLAIAAQITLIAVSVIPYTLMMYLSRGLSMPEVLLALFRLWLSGLLLSALFVSFSWHPSWIVRAGLAVVSLWVMAARHFSGILNELLRGVSGRTAGGMISGMTGPSGNSLPLAAAECLGLAVLGFVFLEFAAGLMEPSENHSTPPRTAFLGLLGLALVSDGGGLYGGTLRALTVPALTAVTVFALTEERLPPAIRPQGRRRWNPLAPGAPRGILFACLVWAAALIFLAGGTLPGLKPILARLAAWLFCGRLLLFLMPRRHRSGAGPLLLTGLFFLLVQNGLRLTGNLLDDPDRWNAAAGVVPSPVSLTDLNNAGITRILAWAGLAGCALAAAGELLFSSGRRAGSSTPASLPPAA